MLQRAEDAPSFSLARARHIIADLFVPKARIYWTDLLVTAAIGNAAFTSALAIFRDPRALLPGWPLGLTIAIGLIAYVICSLAFYRLSMFIHEIAHIRSGTMRGFRIAWNLLCGIPFLMPSFVYYTHLDHHRRKHYGTENDGEYLAFEHDGAWGIFKHLALNFLVPVLAVLRFLVIGPVSWFIPPLRRWVLQRASSLVIDVDYVRPLPATKREAWTIFMQEFLCFALLLGIVIVPPVFLGIIPIPFVTLCYSIGVFILTLNSIRTLGAHRYVNDKHEEMTFVEQLLDSVNVHRRPWLSELWGPVGTRYHALHHLFPGLPYHAMPEAHRRLMAELPAGSPYHQTEEPSLTAALLDLYHRTSSSTAERATMPVAADR
jgi:fatty acid desaturase